MANLSVCVMFAAAGLFCIAVTADHVEAQCLQCGQSTCTTFRHQAAGNTPPEGWDGTVHPCQSGNCDSHHDICYTDDFEGVDLQALRSLATQPAWKLQYLVEKYEDHVVYNHARGALQVLGCDGASVIAHVALRAEQLTPVLAKQ